MAFKVKINVLLLLAILVTIGTAWFSVNHFISGYIRTQATQNINEQITLVKEKLAGDINQKVLLAANLNLGVTSVKKALQETGFHNIVKLIGDMAFDANGVIDDKARVDALRKLIPKPNVDGPTLVKGFPEASVAKIEAPTLVLHGREDGVVPPECGFLLAKAIPRAELHLFGQCGHWVQTEHRARFLQLVRDFCA